MEEMVNNRKQNQKSSQNETDDQKSLGRDEYIIQ